MRYLHEFPITPTDIAEGEIISTVPLLTYGFSQFDALYVGGTVAADVTITTRNGDSLLFADVEPGRVLPVSGRKVNSTGTTATDLVGLRQKPELFVNQS
jgi:hypothetical protein